MTTSHEGPSIGDAVTQAAAVLARATSVAALTGAGMSTESGLPDFRSPGGLWAEFDPRDIATLSAFHRTPGRFYEFYRKRLALLATAAPNPGHRALARLEAEGRLVAVITQNVDGLHQAAGSSRVIELHGNLREAACLECHWTGPISMAAEALDRGELPVCSRCSSRVKPNVVLFEELLPESAYQDAQDVCEHVDALLVVGSSSQVTPAAWLPGVAHERGVPVIIVNDEPTPLDHLARVILRGRAGIILPAIVQAALAR